MNNFILVSAISESDRRLIIIALIMLVLFFVILGLIGIAIKKTMKAEGEQIDKLVCDGVRFRVLENARHFRYYAKIKNRQLFFKQSQWPLLILFISLVFYLIYAGVTNNWVYNYWGDFGSIFFLWDFGDEGSYVTFWGMRLLAKMPPLINTPHFVAENYASYILCFLWSVGTLYFLLVSQAYLSRIVMINRRASSIYKKSLEGYEFYDGFYPKGGEPNPVNKNIDKAQETTENKTN
jgi:hypothetical protein